MIKWKENCALIFCFVLVKLKVKYVKTYDLRANHKVSNKKKPSMYNAEEKNTVNLQ